MEYVVYYIVMHLTTDDELRTILVLAKWANKNVKTAGPLTRKRMETVDDEFIAASVDFMKRSKKADKPFFRVVKSKSYAYVYPFTRLTSSPGGKSHF